ncbi:hypothetical protein BD626DRAFT_83469 [Schizophyllum amplum]|uniref:Uncharacterized protein n=1 Tax=Schizophyllum amplum TaxID=97359 RepID=A0A550BS11_9AGAR|nr:hypothetical protein BD626DRAFT_83469 [Auriculariopsis ampla]
MLFMTYVEVGACVRLPADRRGSHALAIAHTPCLAAESSTPLSSISALAASSGRLAVACSAPRNADPQRKIARCPRILAMEHQFYLDTADTRVSEVPEHYRTRAELERGGGRRGRRVRGRRIVQQQGTPNGEGALRGRLQRPPRFSWGAFAGFSAAGHVKQEPGCVFILHYEAFLDAKLTQDGANATRRGASNHAKYYSLRYRQPIPSDAQQCTLDSTTARCNRRPGETDCAMNVQKSNLLNAAARVAPRHQIFRAFVSRSRPPILGGLLVYKSRGVGARRRRRRLCPVTRLASTWPPSPPLVRPPTSTLTTMTGR